jgi:hypothetical protein
MKKSVLLLTAALLLLSSVTPIFALGPSPGASGSNTWVVAVSGKGVLIPCFPGYGCNLNFVVKGWCVFTGTSTGTNGYCSLTRSIYSASGGYSCEANFYITAWHAAASIAGPIDFFMDSGTVAVYPPSTSSTCAELLTIAGGYHVAPTGTPGLLTITASSDSHFPTTPGHYTKGAGPVTWSEFNLIVIELPFH